MTLRNGDVPALYKYLRDVEHDICAVILLAEDGRSYAHAVAQAATGEIFAWDGWYFEEPENPLVPLVNAEWDEWDDLPTKLLINSQDEWTDARMAYWLIPTFSPARNAAELVNTHRGSASGGDTARAIGSARVIAYLPIADHALYLSLLLA